MRGITAINTFSDNKLFTLDNEPTGDWTLAEDKIATSRATPFEDNFVFIKIGSAFKKILLDDIDYIIYADRYPNLVIEGKYFPLNVTMKDLAKSLPKRKFIQIHQSHIVNLAKITQINMVDNQMEVAKNILPIGISFKKALLKRLTFLT